MPLSKLNNEQYLAATADFGHNLVIASAGTGKTSTIVARISYLLSKGVAPQKIMLLTFTNKASKEMIGRLGKFFDKNITSKILAGTFHSTAYTLLRNADKNIALKQASELKTLLKSVYEKRTCGVHPGEVFARGRLRRSRDPGAPGEDWHNRRSHAERNGFAEIRRSGEGGRGGCAPGGKRTDRGGELDHRRFPGTAGARRRQRLDAGLHPVGRGRRQGRHGRASEVDRKHHRPRQPERRREGDRGRAVSAERNPGGRD